MMGAVLQATVGASSFAQRNAAFIAKVHRKRVRSGFADNIGTTGRIVANALAKTLGMKNAAPDSISERDEKRAMETPGSRWKFFSMALKDTLEITGRGRHDSLDFVVADELPNRDRMRFLDVGCGIDSGFSPTAEDTVSMFGKMGILVEAIALDKNVPDGLDGKTKRGVRYVKMDLFDDKIGALGKFDYIRCSNVLYYFNGQVASKAVSKLTGMLSYMGVLAEDSKTTKTESIVRLHRNNVFGAEVFFEGNPYCEN